MLHLLHQLVVERLLYLLFFILRLQIFHVLQQLWQLRILDIFNRRIVDVDNCLSQILFELLDAHDALLQGVSCDESVYT